MSGTPAAVWCIADNFMFVYSHLPSFSLAVCLPVEHILTCLLSQPYKVALSTVTNHQSHFSTLFLQSGDCSLSQGTSAPLSTTTWIETICLQIIIFHLRRSLLWNHLFVKMLFFWAFLFRKVEADERGVSWVAFTLLAWQYNGNTFCKERGTKFLYNKMSDL